MHNISDSFSMHCVILIISGTVVMMNTFANRRKQRCYTDSSTSDFSVNTCSLTVHMLDDLRETAALAASVSPRAKASSLWFSSQMKHTHTRLQLNDARRHRHHHTPARARDIPGKTPNSLRSRRGGWCWIFLRATHTHRHRERETHSRSCISVRVRGNPAGGDDDDDDDDEEEASHPPDSLTSPLF